MERKTTAPRFCVTSVTGKPDEVRAAEPKSISHEPVSPFDRNSIASTLSFSDS
jgi:hypothetical protein